MNASIKFLAFPNKNVLKRAIGEDNPVTEGSPDVTYRELSV